VEFAVRDEHGRLPTRDAIYRIELLVVLRLFEVRTAELPFREPQLLCRVVHRALIEDPGVRNEAAETLRPLPRNPVDHEAAVGGAQRARALAVQPGVTFQRGGETFLQVFQRLAAPVAADRIREGLSVTGR